ncbi:16S rRNA (guanine(527)-N(7))-methyltransferase RsmG [Tsuneonella sp. YG55]|uniref:Ribosomal RNA small subunit methyltransferase G n=1 Tax=Tsuneonella litorea TaxID=2976475 RepID=A0A9X2VZH7_9SPHN|nr:16S rRNA (guanine(527)-N(7))-methyltransferase RsmG [Tsuneonella litorea]MCT2557863.1 16S rRNA (guanine(527)-N(7))-methyltransferase RsmG [Tsuneonella litorea]
MILVGERDSMDYVAARCDERAMARIGRFIDLLVEENERQNLVAAATLDHVWQRHIADSAQLLEFAPQVPRGTWVDLGSGAGFPGLVIAMMRPDLHVKLVESRRLRSAWLSSCIDALGLDKCEVSHGRAEVLPAEEAAVLSARAFAPLPKAIAIGRRFSTADTVWLLPKGRSAAQEVNELPKRLRSMFHVEQSVSDPEAGIVTGRLTE